MTAVNPEDNPPGVRGLYENTMGALAAGQSKGFKTEYPGTPPLAPTAVKSFKAFAYDFSF